MISMLRQHARTNGQCNQGCGHSKKESKRNIRDQNHCDRNEDASSGLDRHNWGKNFRAQGYINRNLKK